MNRGEERERESQKKRDSPAKWENVNFICWFKACPVWSASVFVLECVLCAIDERLDSLYMLFVCLVFITWSTNCVHFESDANVMCSARFCLCLNWSMKLSCRRCNVITITPERTRRARHKHTMTTSTRISEFSVCKCRTENLKCIFPFLKSVRINSVFYRHFSLTRRTHTPQTV